MTDRAELWVPGRPRVKQRPRLGRRRKAFTPQETVEGEMEIAGYWITEVGVSFDGPVQVLVDYYPDGQNIVVESLVDRTSKLRGDIDNYLKLTLDGLQRAEAIPNDIKVMSVWGEKH